MEAGVCPIAPHTLALVYVGAGLLWCIGTCTLHLATCKDPACELRELLRTGPPSLQGAAIVAGGFVVLLALWPLCVALYAAAAVAHMATGQGEWPWR